MFKNKSKIIGDKTPIGCKSPDKVADFLRCDKTLQKSQPRQFKTSDNYSNDPTSNINEKCISWIEESKTIPKIKDKNEIYANFDKSIEKTIIENPNSFKLEKSEICNPIIADPVVEGNFVPKDLINNDLASENFESDSKNETKHINSPKNISTAKRLPEVCRKEINISQINADIPTTHELESNSSKPANDPLTIDPSPPEDQKTLHPKLNLATSTPQKSFNLRHRSASRSVDN